MSVKLKCRGLSAYIPGTRGESPLGNVPSQTKPLISDITPIHLTDMPNPATPTVTATSIPVKGGTPTPAAAIERWYVGLTTGAGRIVSTVGSNAKHSVGNPFLLESCSNGCSAPGFSPKNEPFSWKTSKTLKPRDRATRVRFL